MLVIVSVIKMNATVSADSVITGMGELFPIISITAEQETCRTISSFRTVFGDVSNFCTSVFLNRKGPDMTREMYKKSCPANIYHLGLYATIPMGVGVGGHLSS